MRLVHMTFVGALAVCVLALQQVRADDCTDWRAGPLTNLDASVGANGFPFTSTTWDPPGAQPPLLVVGGTFTSIEGVAANMIAAMDGAGNWQPLGSGFEGHHIDDLCTYDGDLIACGNVTTADGQLVNGVARWDGVSWHPLGAGLNNAAGDLEVVDGDLIASAWDLHRWNGTSWEVITGVHGGFIHAMTVYNHDLIAAGNFDGLNGGDFNHIARWDGDSWHALGEGLDFWVWDVIVYNGQLIAAGSHNYVTGETPIAWWNGTQWVPLPTVSNEENYGIDTLAVYGDDLIASGTFHWLTDGQWTGYIARWDGSSWSTMGEGMNDWSAALTEFDGDLFAGGFFTTAGGQPAKRIARWDGIDWSPYGEIPVDTISAYTTSGTSLVAAGDFFQTTSTGVAHNIAAWNGAQLFPYGTGTNGPVYALESFTGFLNSRELIAGGFFTSAGGVTVNRIGRWIEHTYFGAPPAVWSPMGSGFDSGAVRTIERFNGTTYAGGTFTASGGTTVNRVAQWNETNDTWLPLGSGTNGIVYALKGFSGQLYAGGLFTAAGGVATGSLARWNGSSWSQVGGAFPNGIVYALEVHDGALIIGGSFPAVAGSTNLVKYDGSAFSAIGAGGASSSVRAIASSGSGLYIGGDFSFVAGVQANRVAVWDGSTWEAVSGGADAAVNALASYHEEVHAGGEFMDVQDDSQAAIEAPSWAKYHETGVPWIVAQPWSATSSCHGSFTPGIVPALGYEPLDIRWRRNGVPLASGSTGSGSTVSGATDELTLINVSDADEGVYDVVISNVCGSVTSATATLTVEGECPPCIGDTDSDGTIGFGDLTEVLLGWGECPPPTDSLCAADLDRSGAIGFADLIALFMGWGGCP